MGIKKLGVGKENDLAELQAEYLKWGSNILASHITKISTSYNRGSPQIRKLVWKYLFSRAVMSIIPPIIGSS